MSSLCELILIDDDSSDLTILELICKKNGFKYKAFSNPEKACDYALAKKKGESFLVVSDISMPDFDGFEILKKLKSKSNGAPIVFVSGNSDVQGPVRAMRLGALDFLLKPVKQELFVARISNAVQRIVEKNELDTIQQNMYAGRTIRNFVGKSDVIKNVYDIVLKVSQFDSTVMIRGESGVGKERIARAVHENSPRAKGPFIAVNSSSIPESLIESELFGHKKGSFTGANSDKVGLIEASSGGTLFLDEIGELPIHLQAKILRVLQEKVVRPVGGNESVPVDLRVVCATHRDLNVMVKEGLFREDLYYRLNVIPIKIPPLRERKEDLEVLIPYIMKKISEKWSVTKALPKPVYDHLVKYSWPGNIRELENVLERAFVLSQSETLAIYDFKFEDNSSADAVSGESSSESVFSHESGRYLTLQELELKYIKEVMSNTPTKEEAARVLGIGRKTLYRKEEMIDNDL